MNNALNASSTAITAPAYSHASTAVVAPATPTPLPSQSMGSQPVIFMLSLMAFMSFLRQK